MTSGYITIKERTGYAAMYALQRSIQRDSRADYLDGKSSSRGSWKVESKDHSAHSEIAAALGESGTFGLGCSSDPTPQEIEKASELAYLLIRFWIEHNPWLLEADKKIPPAASSELTETLTRFCYLGPTPARRIISTVAMAHGLELTSMGDWKEAEVTA